MYRVLVLNFIFIYIDDFKYEVFAARSRPKFYHPFFFLHKSRRLESDLENICVPEYTYSLVNSFEFNFGTCVKRVAAHAPHRLPP